MSRIDDIARERAAEALHVYSVRASGQLHQPWAKTSEPTRDTWRAAVGVVVEAYNSQLMREIDEALMLTEGCATLKEMSAGWAEGTAAIARLAAAESRAQAAEARAAMLERTVRDFMGAKDFAGAEAWDNGPDMRSRLEHAHAMAVWALKDSPSPLAQAINAVLEADYCTTPNFDELIYALRTAWRGAEPGRPT